jgi:hypothetical protein
MTAIRKTRGRRGLLLLGAAIAAATMLLAGCGDDDQEAKPRPPVPVELTGVITERGVTVQPSGVGAGPIIITVSNQTEEAHTLTLEGEGIREQVGPVNPLDTATLQKTVRPGRYVVRAGSEKAVESEIAPATLEIGQQRPDSDDRLLLP